MLNIEEITSLEYLRQLYNERLVKIQILEDDIKSTREALNDRFLNYLDKKEYQNDITADTLEINALNIEIEEIKAQATKLGFTLVEPEEQMKLTLKNKGE